MDSPTPILRQVWQLFTLRGPCHCRRIRGAYRDLWIVHHGRRYEPAHNDYRLEARFVKRARSSLRRAGFKPNAFLFELDDRDKRIRRGPGMGSDPVTRLHTNAIIETDRLPRSQWPAATHRIWDSVGYRGDRIEMWERVLQRSGDLHRVLDIAWSTNTHRASRYETIDYVGAARGARLFFG